jgi:predicted nucleic acid-binding Zn ribbon protein
MEGTTMMDWTPCVICGKPVGKDHVVSLHNECKEIFLGWLRDHPQALLRVLDILKAEAQLRQIIEKDLGGAERK